MAVAQKGETKIWRRRECGKQFAIWGTWLFGTAIFVY